MITCSLNTKINTFLYIEIRSYNTMNNTKFNVIYRTKIIVDSVQCPTLKYLQHKYAQAYIMKHLFDMYLENIRREIRGMLDIKFYD